MYSSTFMQFFVLFVSYMWKELTFIPIVVK